jgi:aldose sugar dehydrogenase
MVCVKKNPTYLGKVLLSILIFITLLLNMILASSLHPQNSSENIIVRVVSNQSEKEFTFSCNIPENSGPTRIWSIRRERFATEFELTTQEAELTYTFSKNDLYHIGCQAFNNTENPPVLLRGDFHIDLKSVIDNSYPVLEVTQSSGKEFNATCKYSQSSNFNIQWFLYNQFDNLDPFNFDGQESISLSVPYPGLWDLVCGVWDIDNGIWKSTAIPIEFFDHGPAYIPNSLGCLPWNCSSELLITSPVCGDSIIHLSLGEQCDDGNLINGDGCSNNCLKEDSITSPTNISVKSCYNSVVEIPASCTKTINSDTSSGVCRTINCGGKQVFSCDKGTHFEMYNQGSNNNIEICIADYCMSDQGFIRSKNFPICIETDNNSTLTSESNNSHSDRDNQNECGDGLVEFGEQCDDGNLISGDGCSNICILESIEMCIQNFNNLPDATCNGGTISLDSLNGGCRTTICSGKQVLSCDKGTHFEMYNQGGSNSIEICLASVCLKEQGYVKSPIYPMCTENPDLNSFLTTNTSSSDWTAPSGFRVELFSSGFDLPVHIAFPPQGMYSHLPEKERPFLYVTELYGKIKVVYIDGSTSVFAENLINFDPFGSITGGGQMGLVGLLVDQNTGDLFAGTVYLDGGEIKNKILKFTTNSLGTGFDFMTTILDNLPSTPSHQIQQLTIGPDGKLYVNLGEGHNKNFAQDDSILAGKIIRLNLDGSDLEIYAKGFRDPFGADWRPGFDTLYVSDNGPDSDDKLVKVSQGGNYGWCCDMPKGSIFNTDVSPVDIEFNPGNSGFPEELNGKLYFAVAGPIYQPGIQKSKHILELTLDSSGQVSNSREFVKYVGTGYGTPIGLDFGPDGLYFTDIYGNPGFVGLGKTEANIYRVVQGDPKECTNCTSGIFRAGISVISWYPKDTGSGIQYIFKCQGIDGSGNYKYDFSYGINNWKSINRDLATSDIVNYPYGNEDFAVSCTVKDQISTSSATANIVVNPDHFIAE